MILEHLRRPIALAGLFLAGAILIVATAGDSDAAAPRVDVPATSDPVSAPRDEPAAKVPESGSAQAMIERGVRAFEIGRYDDAIAFYRAAIRKEPRSAVAYNLLGMAYRYRFAALHAAGDREREIEAFRAAVKLDPEYVPALVNLGVSLHQHGRQEEAAQAINRALTLDPNHPDQLRLSRIAAGQP